jgi:hypothetical protein
VQGYFGNNQFLNGIKSFCGNGGAGASAHQPRHSGLLPLFCFESMQSLVEGKARSIMTMACSYS